MANFVAHYPAHEQSSYEGLSAVNGLIVDGAYLDGSWELCVHVEDINDIVCVRVRGDTSVGGLMHQIVEAVNLKQSWSDHAIWWPQRNVWLLHTRTSLDQYGVQSDAQLMFRHTHGNLRIVLPSLATLTLRVNYASRVFSVVDGLCKELCIRHPEELSLMFPITRDGIKYNQPLPVIRHGVKRTGPLNSICAARSDLPAVADGNGVNKTVSLSRLNDSNPYPTLPYGSATLFRGQSDNSLDEERIDISKFMDCSQRKSTKAAFSEEWLLKPKNVQQKARLDGGWLDSSRSLMEHGIEPPSLPLGSYPTSPSKVPTLYLRFKFYNFYDINTNYDAVRIHQIYEQARWSLLSGVLECTEEEMIVFAAYQLQAELQNESALRASSTMYPLVGTMARYSTLGGYNTLASSVDPNFRPLSPDFTSPRSFGGSLLRMPSLGTVSPISTRPLSPYSGSNGHIGYNDEALNEMDEIDIMLTELEQSCNVSHPSRKSNALSGVDSADSGNAVILQDSIKIFRDKGLLLRRYKEMWAVVKGADLIIYRDPHNIDTPTVAYSLRDCLITPDLSPESARFAVKLSLVSPSSASSSSTPISGRRSRLREDVWLRFNSMEQYAKWVAAFRLVGRGKSLESRAAFDKEFQLLRENLEKQATANATPVLSPEELSTRLGDLTDFCAEGIIKKARSKEALRQKISETHAGIRDLSLQDAKLRYIEEWQRLNNFGRSYCIVQFDKGNPFGLGNPSGGLFCSPGPQEDVIAIRQGRIEVVSASTEETQLAWNFADLRSWNVNWDNGRVILEFRNGKVSFKPLTANCKTVVELIGGYVFLSQRNPEKNQKIDERMFHKLTGAND